MRGHPAVVPLLEYGISSSISGARQWVLVFPRYAGSLRDWRLKWRGRGLDAQDLPVYLRLFLQVCGARLNGHPVCVTAPGGGCCCTAWP